MICESFGHRADRSRYLLDHDPDLCPGCCFCFCQTRELGSLCCPGLPGLPSRLGWCRAMGRCAVAEKAAETVAEAWQEVVAVAVQVGLLVTDCPRSRKSHCGCRYHLDQNVAVVADRSRCRFRTYASRLCVQTDCKHLPPCRTWLVVERQAQADWMPMLQSSRLCSRSESTILQKRAQLMDTASAP